MVKLDCKKIPAITNVLNELFDPKWQVYCINLHGYNDVMAVKKNIFCRPLKFNLTEFECIDSRFEN